MSRIRAKDTSPELSVRHALTKLGYRYRIHPRDLPGKPDIVFTRRRKVIWIHGCFWHLHDCREGRIPSTNSLYWRPKLEANRERDRRHIQALAARGWESLTLWECEVERAPEALPDRLRRFLGPTRMD